MWRYKTSRLDLKQESLLKLYCVRHGHAEKLPDKSGEYPLTEQGIEEVNKVATYLARRGAHVVHVLHSGKLRAKQTAEIFAKAIGNGTMEVCTLLNAECSVDSLLELIQEWHDDTLLVGHMPFMSQLVSSLLLEDESYDIVRFPPGTVVCLDRFEHHRWILDWILRPDLVASETN
jgi:phosphohistidine phosphatase